MGEEYHKPVLLRESLELLSIRSDGIFVDVTFGGGGHSRNILDVLNNGRLYAFDRDAEAHANTIADERFTLIRADFKFIESELRALGVTQVDGILADLGISSRHIDAAERGFSFRQDAPLDMRMDRDQALSARDVVNDYDQDELRILLRRYGEVNNAGRLAARIISEREKRPIDTTLRLAEVARSIAPRNQERKYLSMVFQALRIEVNGELDSLQALLEDGTKMLAPGGRFVVISYHSLEDRMVKRFFRSGNLDDTETRDLYGNIIRPLRPVTRQPVTPSEAEVEENPRARSGRLRAAEKL